MSSLWQNWSGSVNCNPAEILYPTTQAEIVAIVRECRAKKRQVRVVGSGHSFTPLVQTDGVLLNLDKYSGIEKVDREKQQATIRAGTKLKQLGEELFKYGLAQPNLGDIDVQAIAGAISTGTHGSGVTLGSLSTQVVALTLITAEGELIECSAEQNRDIFKAAQVSMGALGIISQITLQLVPAYKLHYQWRKMSLTDCLDNIEKYKQENRNFEFFWLPYTDTVLAKFMNETAEAPVEKNLFRRFNEMVLENGVFWLLSEISRLFPARSKQVSQVLAALVSDGNDINYSHRIFATPRLVRFQEMEYNLPAQHFGMVLREIQACLEQRQFQVHFPIECRFVKSDDIPLSPAYGRESAYIAVHMYKGMEYRPYFEAMETIFKKYEGRPHWGKLHTRTAPELKELYPQWETFQQVRSRLDPDGFFLNNYLKEILAEIAPVKV